MTTVVFPFCGCRVNDVTFVKCMDDIVEVLIHTDKGIVRLYHEQDCCERVRLYDVDGDLQRELRNKYIYRFEAVTSGSMPDDGEYEDEYYTWTFYKINNLTLRWLGESNGYYSEEVNVSFLPSHDCGEIKF